MAYSLPTESSFWPLLLIFKFWYFFFRLGYCDSFLSCKLVRFGVVTLGKWSSAMIVNTLSVVPIACILDFLWCFPLHPYFYFFMVIWRFSCFSSTVKKFCLTLFFLWHFWAYSHCNVILICLISFLSLVNKFIASFSFWPWFFRHLGLEMFISWYSSPCSN